MNASLNVKVVQVPSNNKTTLREAARLLCTPNFVWEGQKYSHRRYDLVIELVEGDLAASEFKPVLRPGVPEGLPQAEPDDEKSLETLFKRTLAMLCYRNPRQAQLEGEDESSLTQ